MGTDVLPSNGRSDVAEPRWGRIRRIAFYGVISLLLVSLGVVFWKVNLFWILAWLPEDVLERLYASQLEFDMVPGAFAPHLSAWSVSFMVALLGIGFVVYPDLSGSCGLGWGVAMIAWAVLFIAAAEARNRRRQRSTPAYSPSTQPTLTIEDDDEARLMAETGDRRRDAAADAHAASIGGRRAFTEVRALIRPALEFRTWELLARDALTDAAIARLLADAVSCAGAGRRSPHMSCP